MPTGLQVKLNDCRLRVTPPVSAQNLWEDVLTDADRIGLGGDLAAAYQSWGTVGMWAEVRGISSLDRALVEVAYELGFLDELGRKRLLSELNQDESIVEQAIDDAVHSGHLVLVQSRMEAFWHGKRIEIDWTRRSKVWDFFLLLCENGKQGRSLDYLSFNGKYQSSYVSKTKSVLRNDPNFPASLGKLIQPAGRYTVRLALPAHQIHIFSVASHDVLIETR